MIIINTNQFLGEYYKNWRNGNFGGLKIRNSVEKYGNTKLITFLMNIKYWCRFRIKAVV